MTLLQQIITIAMVVLGTAITRFLPFLIFPADKPVPKYVQYLGKVLPPAIMAILVVYCLKDINLLEGSRGLPEFLAVALVAVLHLWKKSTLLSIGAGTVFYMILVQAVF